MAIKYLDARRIRGTAAERTALTIPVAQANTSWKKLESVLISGSAVNNMTTPTFTSKDNYVVLSDNIMSTDDQTIFHFGYNNITDNQSSSYTRRMSTNGGSSSSSTQSGAWNTVDSSDNEREFSVIHVRDDGGTDSKPNGLNRGMDLGAATDAIGNVTESKTTWSYDSNRINIFGTKVYGDDSVLAAGSECIVLGMNDNEADSGTNAWQELASTTVAGDTVTQISSGDFTPKRWLWVQVFRVPDGGQYLDYIRFNDDATSGNYHYKINDNRGSSYSSSATGTGILTNETSQPTQYGYGTYWITNPTTKCKGLIGEDIRSGDANMNDDSSTFVQEVYGKWENATDQIRKITLNEGGSGAGYAAGSMMKVWGVD